MSDEMTTVERIFHGAIQIAAGKERSDYLNKACGGDDALERRVQALLHAHEMSGDLPSWTEEPNFVWATEVIAREATTTSVIDIPDELPEREGDVIGRYKLLEKIGQGGFGVVFMAQQLEPITRHVALKVSKLGMDTNQFVARFEAERQALAMMDHPNIARALDAGATASGRPYFVMELVRGERITTYCDQTKLTVEQRLKLFVQVCRAIHHAHQKGVIHRDIKPSNVLVTLQDGVPVPKVIDFGIAKATGAGKRLTDKTYFTGFGQFLGTPAYTSPEQAAMSAEDVDTRSDIYSLGALLYELLTGAPPFDPEQLQSLGFDEMRQTIQEIDPASPSSRVSSAAHVRLNLVAEQRRTESLRLVEKLRGDLDMIVMMAMDKDRSRRYETAYGLALDINRYMKKQPVTARPPTVFYQLGKTIQRHRLAFGAAAAILLAILIGIVGTVRQAIRATEAEKTQESLANRAQAERDRALRAEAEAKRQALEATAARREAEAEAVKSSQVARILKEMLASATPQVALGRDVSVMLEIADNTAARLSGDLEGQPLVEAQLRETLSEIYFSLGAGKEASRTNAQRALELRVQHQGAEHPDIGRPYLELAKTYARGDKAGIADFEPEYARTIELVRKSPKHRALLGNMLHQLGTIQINTQPCEQAIATYTEALRVRRETGSDPEDISWTLTHLGRLQSKSGRFEEGIAHIREAAEIRRGLDPRHPHLAQSIFMIGIVHRRMGELEKAAKFYRDALELGQQTLNEAHPHMRNYRGEFNSLTREMNAPDPRIREARKSLANARRQHAQTGKLEDLRPGIRSLSDAFYDGGLYVEAVPLLRERWSILERLNVEEEDDLRATAFKLADAIAKKWNKNSSQAARRALAESAGYFKLAAAQSDEGTVLRFAAEGRRASVLARQGKWREAAETLMGFARSPNSPILSLQQLALLRAWLQDNEGFSEAWELLADRRKAPEDAFEASCIVRAGVAMPCKHRDAKELIRLIDFSLTKSAGDGVSANQLILKAAAEYRADNIPLSLDYCARASEKSKYSTTMAAIESIQALCQLRQENAAEARRLIQSVRNRIAKGWIGKHRAITSHNWSGLLFANILLREAENEIKLFGE